MSSTRDKNNAFLRLATTAHYRDGAYYDQTYSRRRRDVAFYVEQACISRGPVLELGVGTGRVAMEIARRHVEVIGVDSVPQMLAQAEQRLNKLPAAERKLIDLRLGDLRRIRLRRRFPLVIAPFNVFMHLYHREDIEAALAVCRRHLRPTGRLIFDVRLPSLVELARNPERIYRCSNVRRPGDGKRYNYQETFAYDAIEQIQIIDMSFAEAGRPGLMLTTPLAHRQFFPAELEALLYYNGFTIHERFGDFIHGPLDEYSESQVIVARPRKGFRR